MIDTEVKLYFAYGSNMNLNQMALRCPDAEVVDTVCLEGYRLAFCMNGGGRGVATILPEPHSFVEGVLWRISEQDEKSLDRYEGFPKLYGKEAVIVSGKSGISHEVMAYTMNSPYRDTPALPSQTYLEGILRGCIQNGIGVVPVMEAVRRIRQEAPQKGRRQKSFRVQKGRKER